MIFRNRVTKANWFELRGTDPHTIVTGESKYALVGEGY